MGGEEGKAALRGRAHQGSFVSIEFAFLLRTRCTVRSPLDSLRDGISWRLDRAMCRPRLLRHVCNFGLPARLHRICTHRATVTHLDKNGSVLVQKRALVMGENLFSIFCWAL